MKHISLSNKLKTDTTTISNQFIDTYLTKASGEHIKVFLMLLRLIQDGQTPSTELLAGRLDMTEGAIMRAIDYWEQEGLLSTPNRTNEVASTRESASSTSPKKSALTPEALRNKQRDEDFCHLKYLVEVYLNHPMTNPELNSLSYIYDDLQLPVPLIEYLFEYCISNHKKSIRYIEKVAIDWHKRGIRTVQQAKNQSAIFTKEYYAIMKAMGLSNQPAPAQIEYMEKWIYKDAHSLPVILEACRRTITAIGKPSFPYTGKILDTWKQAGVKSVNEANAYDKQKPVKQANTAQQAQPQTPAPKKHNFQERSYDFDALEQRYIQKINQGRDDTDF